LALVVIILKAGKVYSNLDATKVKYDKIKIPIAQMEYVNAHMSHNILSD
jgi:hypothetical protein